MIYSAFFNCIMLIAALVVQDNSGLVGTYSNSGRGFGTTLTLQRSGDFVYTHRVPAPDDRILYSDSSEGKWICTDSTITLSPKRTTRTANDTQEVKPNVETIFSIVRDAKRNVIGLKSKEMSQPLQKES